MSPKEFEETVNKMREVVSEVNTTIPARIINYDPVSRYADVQPAIDKRTADGRVIPAPIIYGVKVRWPSCKSMSAIISMPLALGDGGLLSFSQRSLEEWASGDRVPTDPRTHDMNDAFFSPEMDDDTSAVPAEADCLLIKIGAAVFRLYPDGHGTLTLPAGYVVDSPLTTFTGDVTVEGNTQVDGNQHTTGQNVSDGDTIAGGISLITHVHSGVQGGNSTSGPPV